MSQDFDLEKWRLERLEVNLISSGIAEIRDGEEFLGTCENCPLPQPRLLAKRRKNTMYAEEESNWIVSCAECYERVVEYYNELWSEYYSSQGY